MTDEPADVPTPVAAVLTYAKPVEPATRTNRWTVWLVAPAAITPFVPFVAGASPIDLIRDSIRRGVLAMEWRSAGLFILGATFFLWPVLFAWLLRIRLGGRPSMAERAILLATGALGFAGFIVMLLLLLLPFMLRSTDGIWVAALSSGGVCVGGIVLIAYLVRRRAPIETIAVQCVMLPLLAHAVLCVVEGAREYPGVGWWLLIPGIAALVIEAVLAPRAIRQPQV